MKKRVLSIVLILAFLIPAGALAADFTTNEPIIFKPMYQDLNGATVKLTVSGKTAKYSLDVIGKTAVTKIVATMQIQVRNSNGTYSNVGKSWTATSSSRTLNTSGSNTVESGKNYRLKATIKLFTGNTYSTETVYS